MNHYDCFTINQLKNMFLMDESNKIGETQSINIKQTLF